MTPSFTLVTLFPATAFAVLAFLEEYFKIIYMSANVVDYLALDSIRFEEMLVLGKKMPKYLFYIFDINYVNLKTNRDSSNEASLS